MKVILLLQTHLCAYQNIEDIHDIRILNNTIKAGGSTKRAQNVGLDWSGWMDGYPLDCYDY